MSQRLLPFFLLVSFLAGLASCQRCYECKVMTDDGEVTREICGRKKDVSELISHLESDTAGYGPWTCD